MVTPRGHGEARLSRDADALVGACRCRREAAWWYPALPTRRGPCTRAVAPATTRLRRCRRVHPGRTRRCTGVGVAWCGPADRPGVPRVNRRTARTPWPRACHRITAWRQAHRQGPGHVGGQGLKARRRGHDRDDGVHGHADARSRVGDGALPWAGTWRKRRGGKRQRGTWTRALQIWAAMPRARPPITEVRRRRECAGPPTWRGSESNRGTGGGNTARPGRCGGRRVTGVPTAETSYDGDAERNQARAFKYLWTIVLGCSLDPL
jgi:hypothetical protein